MNYLRTAHEYSKVLAALSAFVSLVLLASFAACLTCDQNDCCEDSDHEEEQVCACGCALHALMLAEYAPARALEASGPPAERALSVDPAPAYPPFHPPRFSG
jgi:hypothetical protein